MKIAEVISKVKTLKLPKNSYVIFGSGPLAALNIREVNDIDMLVSKELHGELKKAGWKRVVKGEDDEPLVKGIFEAHDSWDFSAYSPTLVELLGRTFTVDSVPFASIEDVRKWKAASGRPNDLEDIKLIDNYLKDMRVRLGNTILP